MTAQKHMRLESRECSLITQSQHRRHPCVCVALGTDPAVRYHWAIYTVLCMSLAKVLRWSWNLGSCCLCLPRCWGYRCVPLDSSGKTLKKMELECMICPWGRELTHITLYQKDKFHKFIKLLNYRIIFSAWDQTQGLRYAGLYHWAVPQDPKMNY